METLIQLLAVLVLIGVVGVGAVALADRAPRVGSPSTSTSAACAWRAARSSAWSTPGSFTFPSFSTEIARRRHPPGRRTSSTARRSRPPDGVAVKVSLVVRVARSAIRSPASSPTRTPTASSISSAQLGLREVVAERTVDELLAERTTIGPALRDIVAGRLGEIGVELAVGRRPRRHAARRAEASPGGGRRRAARGRAPSWSAPRRDGGPAQPGQRGRPSSTTIRGCARCGSSRSCAQGVGNTVVLGVPDAAAGRWRRRPGPADDPRPAARPISRRG